ncbi:PTS glucose transporter subunit IIA [Allokutzneria sp. A3M-2-11 16]|uniref:PTS sugar transporter subunit IIA n=1 Tax=Allokutzneria sp. A3M-2-11 16 TaxID=2962043 RepID=UPI0020B67FC7|nr:PTS glucose transporter subunit IIA [Allokutzneria sp. A3M-2-11 16]MCP3801248.1 PTS glucose transporter subunit IIA [Allokutzneria sp. A3M-2-11 16]
MTLSVLCPVKGRAIPMSAVPDPVFAEAMVGPGIAVDPDRAEGDAVSPVDGTVVTLHPHAFVVLTPGGQAVLVHLGIDTVKLKGEGFTLHVVKGETVRAGQRMITWNPAEVERQGYSPVCPVVAVEAKPDQLAALREADAVDHGDQIFTWSA